MKSLVWSSWLIVAFLLTGPVGTELPPDSPQGTDCTEIKTLSPQASSGVYVIQPPGLKEPFKVYCEMQSGGGWTVFQRRSGPAVSFTTERWETYKDGFGDLQHDHWLGLNKVFDLTKNNTKSWTVRVDLWDHEGDTAFAEYANFRLGNETEAFRLHVGEYKGNAGDAIRGAYSGIDQNGYGFSTWDRDNDGCSPCQFGDILENECASSEGGGGWWYSRCGSASLHGDWHPYGEHIGWASGLHWGTWKGPAPYSLKTTRMMIMSV
ncbi:angiopoietin-related protein 5-like isoform 2-T2 [Aulostomus maculatus]